MALARYTEAEDAALDAAEAAHAAECGGECDDCKAAAWDAEMDRRFEAMRDDAAEARFS